MWRYLIIVVLVATSTAYQVNNDTDEFEFGKIGDGKQVFNIEGVIGPLARDHVTIVPIKTSDCTKLTFVKVRVTNRDSPPAVHVNFAKRIVSIKYTDSILYRHSQYSASTYDISAYGVADEGYCVE